MTEEQEKECVRQVEEENRKKTDLLWAMRTRLLTDEETDFVVQHKEDLFIHHRYSGNGGSWGGGSFSQADLEKRLNEMLLQQFRLRAVAAQINQMLNVDQK